VIGLEDSTGTLGILNVGAGDLKLDLGPGVPDEQRATAAKMVEDLLRNGYSIMVEMPDGTCSRATAFDPAALAYVISEPKPAGRRRGRPRKATPTAMVPAATTRATAVARSAGG